jgi:hypothetical protein
MIDRLYETFCATVTLDNNQAFTTSLMKWFEAHCTAETFVRPLQYLMHRFLSEVCMIFIHPFIGGDQPFGRVRNV